MKVVSPNLPKGKVKTVVIGKEFVSVINVLNNMGIKTILLQKDEMFPLCEQSHPDLHICHLESNKLLMYKQDYSLAVELQKLGFEIDFTGNEKCGTYPKSAALNVLFLGDILLCNKKSVAPEIIRFAQNKNMRIINCNQGYVRCATCVVNEKAVITSDPSVYKALKDEIDVLLISAGNIKLGESSSGMIGGASFLIDEKCIAFCGEISEHPNYILIKKFLEKYEISFICLTNEPLLDMGTAIVLEI